MVIDYFIKKTPKIYETTKEISLYNYSMYLKTDDLRWFSNYHKLKNPKEPSQEVLQNVLSNIFEEILEFTENHKVISKISNIHKLRKLEIKYNDVKRLIYALRNHRVELGMDIFNELLECLSKWNYRIDKKKDVFNQLDKIEKRIQGIKSDIDSLIIKIGKDNDDENTDIEEMIFYVEQGLDMKFAINMKKTSLFKWLLMQRSLKEKVIRQQKANSKN